MAEKKTKTEEPKQNGFSLDYLLKSKQFKFFERNILKMVLKDTKKYTIDEAQKAIDKFKEAL